MKPETHLHHHHILPPQTAIAIGVALLILTGITVWIAGVDLGRLNFFIAMAVASSKALLVALFFMNLRYDRIENGMIFATSFVFLAIFIVLTGTDEFFRGDIAVKGPLLAAQTKSKVKKPWIATPELIAHGKETFAIQCVSCHGAEGKGDGPAASALSPHPRNFHSDQGWTNGRKPSHVFKTLRDGVPGTGMASFATLPSDDRWALVHYVLSLGPTPPPDQPSDLAAIGIDPTKDTAETKEEPTVPIEFAMQRLEVPEIPIAPITFHMESVPARPGSEIYEARCAVCHGVKGEGGIQVRNLGVSPIDRVVTAAFSKQKDSLRSSEAFNRIVVEGLPGTMMPGNGDLSGAELKELFQYVNGLAVQ